MKNADYKDDIIFLHEKTSIFVAKKSLFVELILLRYFLRKLKINIAFRKNSLA